MARKNMDAVIGEILKKTDSKEVAALLDEIQNLYGQSLNELKEEILSNAKAQAEKINDKEYVDVSTLEAIMLVVGGNL